MQVSVKLFAGLKDIAGVDQFSLELDQAATIEDAIQQILKLYPSLEPKFSQILFAVNQQFAERDAPLTSGDELALIPPVSGG